MADVIAVLNQKGGAGKTTLATNLACFAVRSGLRTLLADADPQGTARNWRDHGPEDGPFPAVVGADNQKLGEALVATPRRPRTVANRGRLVRPCAMPASPGLPPRRWRTGAEFSTCAGFPQESFFAFLTPPVYPRVWGRCAHTRAPTTGARARGGGAEKMGASSRACGHHTEAVEHLQNARSVLACSTVTKYASKPACRIVALSAERDRCIGSELEAAGRREADGGHRGANRHEGARPAHDADGLRPCAGSGAAGF